MEETLVKETQPVAEPVQEVAQEEAQEASTPESALPPTADVEAQLTDAQEALEGREAEVADLRSQLGQRDTELQALRHHLASATARYREALLASAPEVPAELVSGATPEEVEASLVRARQIVEKVRSHLEARLAEQRVPAGAPIRSAPDLSSMSAQEKIAYALAQGERR